MRKGERLGLIVGLAVVGLGVGGTVVWQMGEEAESLPPRTTEPALSELEVFEQPGTWRQTGRFKYPEANRTLRFTATDHSYWTLGGRALMQETEYAVKDSADHELTVKGWNTERERHTYTLFTDTGRVVAFEGEWAGMDRTMRWEITHPTTNSLKINVNFREVIARPDRKRLLTKYRTFATVLKDVAVDCHREGDFAGPDEADYGTPAREELHLLGEAGTWGERQFFKQSDDTETEMRILGRARWAAGGHCLVYEGVVTEGADEGAPLLWVKTYDSVVKVYRYAYFAANGAVDHYVGRWDPAKNMMVWRCPHLNSAPSDMSSVIEETFTVAGFKAWTFKVREFGKIVVEGRGDSRRMDD
jgi:hypothetical protein